MEFYKTKHLELASYGCSKSTCAASVLFWPSFEKSMPHTSALVLCRTFHTEAASVIHLLPFCSPVFVLFLVERNRDWVLLVILRDGSFDFQAVVGLSSINLSRAIARSHFPISYFLAFIAALPNELVPA